MSRAGLALAGGAAGTWDPMPWHLEHIYRMAGQTARRAFRGEQGIKRLSRIRQPALVVA